MAESPHGTLSSMDVVKRSIQKNMEKMMRLMTDIAHASHHIGHLSKAVESGNPSRGLTMAPRKMLMHADNTIETEWQEQTKTNTLGCMRVTQTNTTHIYSIQTTRQVHTCYSVKRNEFTRKILNS